MSVEPAGSPAGVAAGGTAVARVTTEPLDAGAILSLVAHAGAGAAVLFVGTVRDVAEGRPVAALHYDAYTDMAARELATIVAEARMVDGALRVAVVHRVGELEPGETCVVVAASHPHRAPAFDACRYVIEELKRRVPIWKHELYADGSAVWVGDGTPVREPAGADPGRPGE